MADTPVGFRPEKYDSGKVVTKETASTTTITKQDALAISSGYVQRATSSTSEVRYVALEDVTTGTGHEDIMCVEAPGVSFRATCNSTPTAGKVGYYADLTDHNTVDETSTSNNVFFITEVVDTSNKIIKGFFVPKHGA